MSEHIVHNGPPQVVGPLFGSCTRTYHGFSTVLASMDFETYTEAGLNWSETEQKWIPIVKKQKNPFEAVGTAGYAEHRSTEALSLGYNLKDGYGPRIWTPDREPPYPLFNFLSRFNHDNWLVNGALDGLIECWNTSFEYEIWMNVCVPKYGWPRIDYRQLRDVAAKSRQMSFPGALADAGKVTNCVLQKLPVGERLIKKFSGPRNPTKNKPQKRIFPKDDPEDFKNMLAYNIRDIDSEDEIAAKLPDLTQFETEVWLLDQKINFTGTPIDLPSVEACCEIVTQCADKYNNELYSLTDKKVKTVDENKNFLNWIRESIPQAEGIAKDKIPDLLEYAERYGLKKVIRALEIRQLLASASVKKIFSMKNRVDRYGRLRNMFIYAGADRTKRFAGEATQPHNLKKSGVALSWCENGCGHYYGAMLETCPWCGQVAFLNKKVEWTHEAFEDILFIAQTRSLKIFETFYGDAIKTLGGIPRGLFYASTGHEFICSDFSSIEGVVTAFLAGEQWQIDVFRTHGKIYEMTAAMITGVPFEEILEYKRAHGVHHPLRNKTGKPGALASGFGGAVVAWRNSGAEGTDEEIVAKVKAWRKKNKAIVNMWYRFQEAAVLAIRNPGECYSFNGITFGVIDNCLIVKLLSGSTLKYHEPRLELEERYGRKNWAIYYKGWNTNTANGKPRGWIEFDTWGGTLTENIVQATARDILCHAMLNLDKAGYNIVLHVHDEIVAEVPEGWGSVEEFEKIMSQMPSWCSAWPVRAAGGWRGKRYRKD